MLNKWVCQTGGSISRPLAYEVDTLLTEQPLPIIVILCPCVCVYNEDRLANKVE